MEKTVQRMENLSYGQIKFTEQKFYRVSGQSTQHKGVVPDIELPYVYSNQESGEMSYENALPITIYLRCIMKLLKIYSI